VQQRRASALFAASFVCARATASAIRRLQPATVTLIATGDWIDRDGDEDHACADYLQALLRGEPDQPDPTPFVERVRTSDFGRRFNDPGHPAHPAADLGCAAIADRFDFALEVTRADDLLIMTKAMP
jgi:2-phosphosulfolactate phosphatase